MSFETTARLGYAALALLLAAAMTFSIHRLSNVADEQRAQLRSEANEITLVERLRWTSELMISNGRGYLLSGEPALFAQVEAARARFDENVRLLRQQTLSSTGEQLIAEVQQSATDFTAVQDQLMSARRQAAEPGPLVHRFDVELLPRSRTLDDALARLVDYKEQLLEDHYAHASADRAQLERRLYALLGIVVLAGLAIAWRFSALLSRSYRKETEARDSARKAVAARDEVMGIVAHDLRNPLGAITMRAALLGHDADSSHVRTSAYAIENVARRMEYLIKTMLDVATMDAGRFSVIRTACDVEDLLRDTITLFEPLAAAKHVSLEPHVTEPGLVIRADRERVLQVLSNLLGNALKFTPSHGRVTVTVERSGDDARFAVVDSGPGIPRENLERVFDRYWHEQAPVKGGTGLGLFISKAIIDAHGGRIWAESEPGHGARLYFTLPLELGTTMPLAKTVTQPDPQLR